MKKLVSPRVSDHAVVAKTFTATNRSVRHLSATLWAAVVALSVVVAVVSFRYLLNAGPIPPNIAHNRFRTPWIIIHASAAATALLLGPFQFFPAIRQRWSEVHRWMGRAYVAGCLIGGASALVLAAGISSGPVAGAGFGALGSSWIYATWQGLATARAQQFAEHRRWMIRSFALTFAAVMLRIYLPASALLGIDFTSAYRVIAWLAWIPNLVLAETYLSYSAFEKRTIPSRTAALRRKSNR